jgi:hypothetical protein
MPRSSTDTRRLASVLALAWLAALAWAAPAAAQVGPGRFVDLVELNDHDDQADILVQFTCSLRYLTHQPATEGKELRLQMQPQGDCRVAPGAQIAGELPPVSGGGNILDAVRVDADVPGQATLVFSFRKSEHYVVAQGVDTRSIRLRLIDRARGRGKVLVGEPLGPVTSYAVNLESQPRDFDPRAVEQARQRVNGQVFVGQAVVDGQTWFRLRAGPFDKRSDAERVLAAVSGDYPRAWLAIGDDSATTSGVPAEVLPSVERIASDKALDAPALAKLVADAKAAMNARDYPKAITFLTRIQRQPEFAQRAAMQELLGLARERSGQLAHAKAEYEEYLRRYPAGEAADRVARRLQVLRAASMQGRTGTGGGGDGTGGWSVSGGFGQMYRYDGTTVNNTVNGTTTGTGTGTGTGNANQSLSQNALYNDVDLLARHRGERYDFMSRVSAGYSRNFGAANAIAGANSATRVTVASVELADRQWGLLARVGRQSRNGDGVLGTFDGVFASWQALRSLGLNVAAGYPVETTTAGTKSGRQFWAVSVPYTPPGAHWDASVFYTQQKFDGLKDRTATGGEARILLPKASVTALVDYDVYFKSLNAAALLGTIQLPARWNLSFDAEKRNAPVIGLRSALIGQPVTTIAEMEQVFTPDEIHQFAIDRTAVSSNYSLTLTRPVGQRYQFAMTVGASQIGATPASGGVPATEATGLNLAWQAQLYGSSLWREGDFSVLSAAYSDTETGKIASLGVTSRMPIGGAWRLGPRLTIDHRQLASDGSKELSLVPSALLDYQRGRNLLQFEVGGQIGKRDNQVQTQNTRRYYVSLAYRIGF